MTACAFPSYVYLNYLPSYVMLNMHSKDDETGILEVLENKFLFTAQPRWEDFHRILLKFSPRILKFSGGISVKDRRVNNL